MSESIFDLEQQIMKCWNMVDDVEELYYLFGDDPFFAGMSAKAEDKQANLLLGLISLYGYKFEKLFKTFEDVTREYHQRGKKIEQLQEQVRVLSNERESFDEDPILKQHDDYLMREWQQMQESFDFVEHEAQEREDKAQRRSHSRIDVIGQNGNDGLHYETTQRYSIDDATAEEWDEMRKAYYKGEK